MSPRGASDSLEFDVALDAMIGAGYRVDEAVDLMLAPAVENDDRLRAYYDAHVPTVEPWDGPAAIVFADGDRIGAALDRNGLRPLRWCRTESGKVLAASEAGVIDFGDDPIVERGRLGPGERIVVRFATGELIRPDAFRALRRGGSDFRATVASWHFAAPAEMPRDVDAVVLRRDLVRFGYTSDEMKQVVLSLAGGVEPMWSMGDDAAQPYLERRTPVAGYLRQRFAQVTNPAIDPLREGFVFDMRAFVGSGDSNGDVPAPGSIVAVDTAVLEEGAFDALAYDARLVPHRIELDCAGTTLRARITAICDDAERAVRRGKTYLVLDDRAADLPVPAVLAAGAVHQRLTAVGLRMQASIAACDGFARDAHGCAAVIAAGANVMTPWLAARVAVSEEASAGALLDTLRVALVKVLAKLGICTLRSYVGAQTFETLGLKNEIVSMCFPGMATHAQTLSFDELEEDLRAWAALAGEGTGPPQRGLFRYRRDGVKRHFDPSLLKNLRKTIVARDDAAFLALSDQLEERETIALRDLVEPVPIGEPVPLDEVESEDAITARFTTAAMSLGALGPEAHEAVALGAKLAGARSNGGEGGEDPSRTLNAIKQVASARFGVAPEYLATAEELEIKIAQGAKPGEGGQIPGFKVTAEIAGLRGAVAGQSLVSPPPHHDIYSIEDLAQLIYDLRRANAKAKIAVKLVAQSGIGYVASGVAKARADVVHIAGHDGGTGASPLGSIKHAGLPWELGLVETHHTLVANGLRGRVALRVDGGFKTGRDVIVAAMLGADMFGFGTALLIALGCIYAHQCHLNTCPVGIATQDAVLRGKFPGSAEDAVTFLRFVARDVRRRLAALGARSLDEIRGRSDLVRPRNHRAHGIDLDELLRLPETRAPYDSARIDNAHLDDEAIAGGTQRITPADRAVGTRLAYDAVVRKARGEYVAPAAYRYAGSAGQSFGAFLAAGLTLELDGEANDGVGKGMSGGLIVVRGAGAAARAGDRQRVLLRRARRRGVRARRRRRAARGAQQRRDDRGRGCRRSRLRVHDQGHRRDPRRDRAQPGERDDRRRAVRADATRRRDAARPDPARRPTISPRGDRWRTARARLRARWWSPDLTTRRAPRAPADQPRRRNLRRPDRARAHLDGPADLDVFVRLAPAAGRGSPFWSVWLFISSFRATGIAGGSAWRRIADRVCFFFSGDDPGGGAGGGSAGGAVAAWTAPRVASAAFFAWSARIADDALVGLGCRGRALRARSSRSRSSRRWAARALPLYACSCAAAASRAVGGAGLIDERFLQLLRSGDGVLDDRRGLLVAFLHRLGGHLLERFRLLHRLV